MRILLCGVRGSTPAPGEEYLRYGGHTSCVAIARDGAVPTLVLDAGTGLRRLSALLEGAPFTGSILLSHLHWDHTHGLPFFPAGDRPDASITVYVPAQGDPLAVLGRAMSPPHFPITPDELRGDWTFASLEPGTHDLEGFSVLAAEIPHKGGRTFGFRVSDGTGTVAYLSDHCPTELGPGPDGAGEYHDNALALARDADVLIHDAQYIDADFPAKAHFGHSTCGYAMGLARAAGAREVVLFHHDPVRTDDEVDAIVDGLRDDAGPPVRGASEGAVFDLGR